MNNIKVIVDGSLDTFNIITPENQPCYNVDVVCQDQIECNVVIPDPENISTVVGEDQQFECNVPGAQVPSNHAITHHYNGSDPLNIGDVVQLPNNPSYFLNGTGGFSLPDNPIINLSSIYYGDRIEIINSNGSGVILSGATAIDAGLLTTGTQIFSGEKTFLNKVNFNYANFSGLNAPPIYQEGNFYYDNNENTVVVETDIQDAPTYLGKMLWERVVNKTTGILHKGTVVYVSGEQGSRQKAWPAIANNESMSSTTFGVIQSDIAINAEGKAITFGHIGGLDFSSYTDGDILYLSPTVSGGYTKIKPTAPNHMVKVGQVVRNQNNGSMHVSIQNGFEMNELHDALIVNKKDGDILQYDGITKVWKNSVPDKSPQFSYTSGDLTRVDYSNGNYKLFSYTNGNLTQMEYILAGRTINKVFSYNIDGNLESISQTEIYN